MHYDSKIPLLSVIMGAHNIGKIHEFDRIMQSVLTQTMNNFEFVICDDGSTDETWECLQEYAAQDSRIKLLRNKTNIGLAATLNYCIENCKGRFIARQDADDFSTTYRFERQIEYLDKHKDISFVGSNVTLWDEHGEWGRRTFPEFPCKEDFLFTMPFVHGALMFRRECIDAVKGYRIAKETRRAEDYDMLMRMYAVGLKGANIQQILYRFCENEAAQQRRKYCYRIDEVIVRWKRFADLNLLPQGIIYVIKPLIVGLIPSVILKYLKKLREF